MSAVRILLQIIGIIALILGVTIITLKTTHQDADGPSILFPGGELVSGELHSGAEPNWSFTDDISVIELQLDNPLSSRRIFIMESDGKVYVPSGYMRSALGKIWKDWAFQADQGDGLAVARIEGVRYERQLLRIKQGPVLDGIVAKLTSKYGPGATRAAIEAGDVWIFEMAPRGI
ncbi:MAG: hypothetical protein GXP16_04400 [Gammaproteobacteria bacterium]|nr:hypothetical protein [Gammaproteobacteria bacterium]